MVLEQSPGTTWSFQEYNPFVAFGECRLFVAQGAVARRILTLAHDGGSVTSQMLYSPATLERMQEEYDKSGQ